MPHQATRCSLHDDVAPAMRTQHLFSNDKFVAYQRHHTILFLRFRAAQRLSHFVRGGHTVVCGHMGTIRNAASGHEHTMPCIPETNEQQVSIPCEGAQGRNFTDEESTRSTFSIFQELSIELSMKLNNARTRERQVLLFQLEPLARACCMWA